MCQVELVFFFLGDDFLPLQSSYGTISAMNYLSQNLKYLLLEKGVERSDWIKSLASSLGCDERRAQGILKGQPGTLSQREMEVLAHFAEIDFEKLASEDLIEARKVDVFALNLSFLLERLPHGKKKHLAENLGVDQTTISRWGNGTQRPTKKKIRALADYFSLPKTMDLEKEPIFLSTMPIGEAETKQWLKERIDELDRETLRELVPALIMLLKHQKD
jgi:transcriptional regulator with XRE-family HTH domain